ncbi:MAG: hypothetical protein WBG70_16865, partial [Spirulinaceae cyanobacterium]
MAKEIDVNEFKEFETGNCNQDATVTSGLRPSCKQPDATKNVTRGNQSLPEFPATKSAVASFLQTTRQNLTKTWLKPLETSGYEFYIGRKISENGFNTLVQLMNEQKESGVSPKEFIENLPISEHLATYPEAQQIPESECSEAINPYQIEVPDLPELPVLNAEIVQVDTPEILKQKSINDKLQDLIEVATARTHQQIEEANQVAAQTQAAQNQITQLAKLH